MKTRSSAQSAHGKVRRESNGVEGACPSPARPLRALFMHLNQAEPSAYGRRRIADHAEQSMRVIQLGLGAIGHLLAHSAVQVEERTIPSECVESLGILMAELGELAALCHQFCTDTEIGAVPPAILQEGRGS